MPLQNPGWVNLVLTKTRSGWDYRANLLTQSSMQIKECHQMDYILNKTIICHNPLQMQAMWTASNVIRAHLLIMEGDPPIEGVIILGDPPIEGVVILEGEEAGSNRGESYGMLCGTQHTEVKLQVGFEKSHRSKSLVFMYSVFTIFAGPVYGRT